MDYSAAVQSAFWRLEYAYARWDNQSVTDSPEVLRTRDRLITLAKWSGERITAAVERDALEQARLIEQSVAEAPPFTPEQEDLLRTLLAPVLERRALAQVPA